MKTHKLFSKDYETLEPLFVEATNLSQEDSCMVMVFIHNMEEIKQLPEHEIIYLDYNDNPCEEYDDWKECNQNIIYHNTWSEQLQLGSNDNVSVFYYGDVNSIERFADQVCTRLFVENLYEDGKTPSEMFGITHEQLSNLEDRIFNREDNKDEL